MSTSSLPRPTTTGSVGGPLGPTGPSFPPMVSPAVRRVLTFVFFGSIAALAYVLRGVLAPLFFAFLLAYALDPFVDWLEVHRVPRTLAAPIVMLAIAGFLVTVLVFAVPLFVDELRDASADLPTELKALEARVEPWLWQTFHFKPPHTMTELGIEVQAKLRDQFPDVLSAASTALFGTLSYMGVVLSALIVPVFALYLLIDFDRIVGRMGELVPRRLYPQIADVARQIHRTLGGYVRGQLTTNIVLGALYAVGLRYVGIRLAVPIGVLTGMLAFVPYIGFGFGLSLALGMSMLDWHGPERVVGVLVVMLGTQVLDGLVITPRIVGRSVGLAPIEVLITMMAAGTLFGFLGVLFAVPLGAVVKILVQRLFKWYVRSDFYSRPGSMPGPL